MDDWPDGRRESMRRDLVEKYIMQDVQKEILQEPGDNVAIAYLILRIKKRLQVTSFKDGDIAFHPDEKRMIRNGDFITIDRIMNRGVSQIYLAWKCKPELDRFNHFLGVGWQALSINCFSLVHEPIDWKIGLHEIIQGLL